MRNKTTRWIALPLLAFAVIVGCVNIHVYLYDEEQAKQVAEKLVRDIRTESIQDSSPANDATDMEESDTPNDGAFLFFGSSVAYAQNIDISKENPQVRKLKEELIKIEKKLGPFFDAGLIGEATDGSVALRVEEKDIDPRKRVEIRKVMNDVNDLRTKLYREVIRSQNVDIDEETMEVTQKLFAEEWRKWTRKGWWYMDPKTKKWKQQDKTLEERDQKQERK